MTERDTTILLGAAVVGVIGYAVLSKSKPTPPRFAGPQMLPETSASQSAADEKLNWWVLVVAFEGQDNGNSQSDAIWRTRQDADAELTNWLLAFHQNGYIATGSAYQWNDATQAWEFGFMRRVDFFLCPKIFARDLGT